MAQTIDSLQIEISASASSAATELKKLSDSLARVRTDAKGGAGLGNFKKKIDALSDSLADIDENSLEKLDKLATTLDRFGKISEIKVSKSIAGAIDGIGNALSKIDETKLSALDRLADSLDSLNSIRDLKLSSTIGTQINSISAALYTLNENDFRVIEEMVDSLSRLSEIGDLKLSSSIPNQLENIAIVTELLRDVDLSKLAEVADNLRPLSELNSADGLAQVVRQLKKLPEITESLNGETLAEFSEKIKTLNEALVPLANNMNSIANGFTSFPTQIRRVADSTSRLNTAAERSSRSTTDLLSNFVMLGVSLKSATVTVSGWIDQSNKYVEDVNLFTASMGQFADNAKEYAETVSEIMGIDPSNWLRNQGVFMTLASGFGVATNRASVMSQQLTQLGYDLASFYNVSVEDSMQRLQSAIAGELEPVRRLGMDLSEARLKAIALSLGIDKTYKSMNQAEKSQLRYYAIMTQVTTAQGDMARTLESPANQLRILQAQVTQAARALGNVFIPALNAIIPYAIAAVRAIRTVASAIASLFGFKLPTVDYSSIGNSMQTAAGGASDMESSLGGAGKKAKELKTTLASFDEINLIASENDPSGGGGGGGADPMDGSDWDWELPTYDFLDGLVSTKLDEIYKNIEPVVTWIADNIETIIPLVEAVGAGFAMWKLSNAFLPNLKDAFRLSDKIRGVFAAISTVAITLSVSTYFQDEFLQGGSFANMVASWVTLALGTKIATTALKATGSPVAAAYVAPITIGLDILFKINSISNKIVEDGALSWRTALSSIAVAIEGAIAGYLGAKAIGASAAVGGAIGVAISLGLLVAVTAVKLIADSNDPAKLVTWGETTLTPEELKAWAEGQFTFDVQARIASMSLIFNDRDQAINDLNSSIESVESSLKLLRIGVDTSPEAISALKEQITGENGLLANLNAALAASESSFKNAMAYVTPSDESGTPLSSDLFTHMLTADSLIMETATNIGTEMSKYLADGFSKGLDSEEYKMALEMGEWLNRISRAVATGQAQGEMNAKTQIILGKMTKDTAGDALAAYANLEKEIQQKYEEIAIQSKADLGARVAGTYESAQMALLKGDRDQYENLIREYVMLSKEYDNFDVSQSALSGFVEAVTPSREMLRTQIGNVFGDAFANIDPNDVFGYLNHARIEEPDLDGYVSEVQQILDRAIQDGLGKDNYEFLHGFADSIGVSDFSLLTDSLQAGLYEAISNAIGKETTDEVFKSLGYNMPEIETMMKIFPDQETLDAGNSAVDTALLNAKTSVTDTNSEVKTSFDEGLKSFGTSIQTDFVDVITSASVSAANEVIHVSDLIASCVAKADELRQIGRWWTSGRSSTNYVPKQYANGGFPDEGQMFIAREAGAEMVGSIGRRTAVANNDQIVSGIASGVASANSNQDALLREQNDLLRKLLAKEGKVVFPTSAEAGRAVSKSIKMYDVARGMA